MTDPFHVKGPDGITRGLDEHYDAIGDVEQDPTGAWLAIQNLWSERERLTAERDALRSWLKHERAVCEAAGDRAGTIAYNRVLAKMEEKK